MVETSPNVFSGHLLLNSQFLLYKRRLFPLNYRTAHETHHRVPKRFPKSDDKARLTRNKIPTPPTVARLIRWCMTLTRGWLGIFSVYAEMEQKTSSFHSRFMPHEKIYQKGNVANVFNDEQKCFSLQTFPHLTTQNRAEDSLSRLMSNSKTAQRS